jgi:hypothetical protein
MSDQASEANKFAREVLGQRAEEAAKAAGPKFTVLDGKDGDGTGTGEPKKSVPWVRLPTAYRTKLEFAREVGHIVATEEIFQRDGVPVTVDAETGLLEAVSAAGLITKLERWMVFYQVKMSGEEPVKLPVSMNLETARVLLAADEFRAQLRPIRRVNKVRMPVRRADGRPVLLPEGYDEESGIYTLKSGLKIDEAMSIEHATARLDYYLREFGFEDPRSKAVQICAMESLFGTCMLPLEAARMGFVWRSNDRGGGKSLLAEMAIVAPFGLPATADIRDRNKLAETFDSAALQSEAYIFFDNLEGAVKNTLIDNFITAPSRRVRLFHTQKTVEAVAGTVLLFTGNNLEVSPDIDRRTLLCRLFVQEFDLQERRIENFINVHKLMQPAVRGEILGALWALIRNWASKGFPAAGERGKPYRRASFEEWSDVFGGIVQAAGYHNPLQVPPDEKSASPERVHQRRLVECLALRIPAGERRAVVRDFQDIVDICYTEELFGWKLLEGGRTWSSNEGETEHFQPTKPALAWLGRFMTESVCGRESGREYVLAATTERRERRVRIGFEGRGRHRSYWLEWSDAK